MKTMYITDLDGTLLNPKAELSPASGAMIAESIDRGALFTIATARTFATVLEMFSEVKLNLPIVLMNGVMVYDPSKNEVIKCNNIKRAVIEDILCIYDKYNISPLVYFYRDGYLEIVYSDESNPYQMAYVNKRTAVEGKTFTYSPQVSVNEDDKVVYIVTLDTYDRLAPLYEEILKLEGASAVFYEDNYTDCYFLEIFAENVSKATGLAEIKELIGADRVVAFGDNLNDIDMFRLADEAYAVSNANDELKKYASSVIGSNNEDAVARYIYNDVLNKENSEFEVTDL